MEKSHHVLGDFRFIILLYGEGECYRLHFYIETKTRLFLITHYSIVKKSLFFCPCTWIQLICVFISAGGWTVLHIILALKLTLFQFACLSFSLFAMGLGQIYNSSRVAWFKCFDLLSPFHREREAIYGLSSSCQMMPCCPQASQLLLRPGATLD